MRLIDGLIKKNVLHTPEIINAFNKIKRKDFLLSNDKKYSEINEPISIGYGQTNSQPETVALMLELLRPKQGDKILDIGCGSGWTTALLAEIAGKDSEVFGIKII